MENLDTGITENDHIIVDDRSKKYFREIAKWANFLAIVGFILLGIMLLASLFMIATAFISHYGAAPMALMAVMYILMAGLYFFPTYYLFKFARKTKIALHSNSQEEFNKGIENLKSMFKFMGILMIVLLSIYALTFVIGLMSGISRF